MDLLGFPLVEVRPTPYGGRGVFAASPIPKNTVFFSCPGPYAFVIDRAFRKEVCSQCFAYAFDAGRRTWNIKHDAAGACFCSDECKTAWMATDRIAGEKVFKVMETLFKGKRLGREGFLPPPAEISLESINEAWRHPPALHKFAPMSELEHDSARFIASGVIQRANNPDSWPDLLQLQDNELLFTQLHPEMLESHLYIGVFVAEALRIAGIVVDFDVLATARCLLARDYGNVFGLYEEKDDTEMFGFAIYTTASLFNHDCTPNIKKTRDGRALAFRTLRDVAAGEELCISYVEETDSWEKRQARLQEWWFFSCQCAKCHRDEAAAK
ncbi:SET domain-containing protein [Cylindrobasidium torrendii FP15055 ss-10]|uniref:SET domain-containing protein n=1 Tax=Cylindrobasidium torrendii FP15055 ss-10 TaxID=1314674 RepID=A0A0D7BQ71_9AGAR|nr:SET domain-containing protein [Cylindrobasidium torrendii FP15055 ss-10]